MIPNVCTQSSNPVPRGHNKPADTYSRYCIADNFLSPSQYTNMRTWTWTRVLTREREREGFLRGFSSAHATSAYRRRYLFIINGLRSRGFPAIKTSFVFQGEALNHSGLIYECRRIVVSIQFEKTCQISPAPPKKWKKTYVLYELWESCDFFMYAWKKKFRD